MKRILKIKISLIFCCLFLFVFVSLADSPYLILIDKVFSRNSTWQISIADYALIRDMGFNVLSPRWSTPANGLIPRDLELCREHNLSFLPWLRGTFPNEEESTFDQRLTARSGASSPLFSPNSDIFWRQFEERLLQAAAIPAPNLGIFLDFEHYASPKIMEPYGVSYDVDSMDRFTAATGKNAKEDHAAFSQWTLELWRQRSTALAGKVKQLSPDFKAFIYPGISSPFLSEFATALRAVGIPVFSAAASTYERPTFMSLAGAREHVANVVENGVQRAENSAPGAKYLAGLDPAVKGSTPQLYDLTMRIAAEKSAGYWIFFEGVKKGSPLLDEYCQAFTRANKAIKNNNFNLADIPPEAANTQIPKFERPGAKKVFLSGERRKSISNFLNTTLPEKYEALSMSGAVLEEIKHFDLLILQSLRLLPADYATVAAALRDYVSQGGTILLSYQSVLAPVALFPEIAVPPTEKVDYQEARRRGQARYATDKLTKENERHTVYYPFYYAVTPGPAGQVLATDSEKNCVAVGGVLGKGKVIFAGDFFGRQDDFSSETERVFFLALLKWLESKE